MTVEMVFTYFRLGLLAFVFSTAGTAAAGTIYNFKNPLEGISPLGPLTADSQGNLYGTAFNGGIPPRKGNTCYETRNGCGVVFKLTQNGMGGWTYNIIYKFRGAPNDAEDPADVLAIDAAGNIYGTTFYGAGAGSVYQLSPAAGGAYTEKVVYTFNGAPDGNLPNGVIVDAAGNLFGTTTNGGTFNMGIVWELIPNTSGGWTETILHSFGGPGDGQDPRTALLLDAAGNLFGTTSGGGYGNGCVFKLSTSTGGGWTESVIYSFVSSGDGMYPYARLVSDAAGNLFGTTQQGTGYGTVFELSPSGAAYTEKIIHHFLTTASGAYPMAPVAFDSAGNLYGTTEQGGLYNYGTVFKLTPNGNGGWVESPVHNFTGNGDGALPLYGVIVGPDGNIYGTTPYGGVAGNFSGNGVVFEYKP